MAGKRSKRKQPISLKHVIMLVGVLTVFSVLFIGIIQKQDRLVSQISIEINKLEEGKSMISVEDAYEIIEDHAGFDIDRASFKAFDLAEIEKLLNKDKRVKSANVYFDKHNKLHVDLIQRQPIVRIDDSAGMDYYLDIEGERIPVATTSILRLPIATGSIEAYRKNFKNELNSSLKDVFVLASKVNEDDFLKPLVEQIHVNSDGTLTMIPKLGRNKIFLGSAMALDVKLSKLKVYYKKGIKQVGLDRFSEINLSYEGQIVGIK